MRINSISSSPQCSFGSFKVTQYGAQVLAEKFVEDPKLEAKFMLNIAKPLDSVDGDVVFDGYRTTFKHLQEEETHAIVQSYGTTSDVLAVVTSNYSRQGYRKLTDVTLSNIFRNRYPLNEIEAAKNIMIDKDCFYSKVAADKYTERHKNETVEQKAERLKQKFGIDA